jgi:hypothetical protein
MPGWICLKLAMAVCWKVSWNVDPLPLSVPLRAALLDEDALLDDESLPLLDGVDGELDEEHAARDRAVATTATPSVVTCCLRRSCISGTPYVVFICFLGRDEQPQPVSTQPWCASTVWRRRWYPRANGQWTNVDEKVKFWCPGSGADW